MMKNNALNALLSLLHWTIIVVVTVFFVTVVLGFNPDVKYSVKISAASLIAVSAMLLIMQRFDMKGIGINPVFLLWTVALLGASILLFTAYPSFASDVSVDEYLPGIVVAVLLFFSIPTIVYIFGLYIPEPLTGKMSGYYIVTTLSTTIVVVIYFTVLIEVTTLAMLAIRKAEIGF